MNEITCRVHMGFYVVVVCWVGSPAFAADKDHPKLLPGTAPLAIERPLHEVMVSGIDRFALRELALSVDRRGAHWNRDNSNPEAYSKSIAKNRERFRTIIGAVDPRAENARLEVITNVGDKTAHIAESKHYTVTPVRWPVLEGVTAEGLLLQPKTEPRARVIALPDADWTPEQFLGLGDEMIPESSIPRRLAASGVEVLIPTLISRDDTFSGNPSVAMTNQTHREFVYRMAFQMGRHVIGYEVQRIRAAVDAFKQLDETNATDLPIGVVGVGEGGLLALYSAAADERISAAMVSGYFQRREDVWQEPIYRNVWSLLTEFGDAEIACLVAPRGLVVEACSVPEVAGRPKVRSGRRGGAAPGAIKTAELINVRAEFQRAKAHYEKLGQPAQIALVESEQGKGHAGSAAALELFADYFEISSLSDAPTDDLRSTGRAVDPQARQKRQFDELVDFTQTLLRHCARRRDEFWSDTNRSSVEKWTESSEPFRNHIHEELFGKLPEPTTPPNVRTRKVIENADYTAYEVMLDVYPDVVAGGILLLPTDLKQDERRPVVVCQHGLEGTPMDTITADGRAYGAYKSFSAQLAKRGFVVYAPQNPYIGGDKFRTLQRKSNPLKLSLFSYIIRQHEQTLKWLSSLPYVDPQRIGFYGLSYGGKTAVRVPPMLKQYALSICSADFDEWNLKNTTNEAPYSYIFTGEYEIFEWNMGHVANYAELSNLMVPRPFMVERGHNDGVAPDEWVAWEYAKVRRHYVQLGLADKTTIEFFDGPHTINGVGTFEFLHKHLDWPVPAGAASGDDTAREGQ